MKKRKPVSKRGSKPSSSGASTPVRDWVSDDRRAVMHPFSVLPEQRTAEARMLVEAREIYVTDLTGRTFIDAGSGLWCVNVGYGRTEIADAMASQCRRLSYALTFATFSNEPQVQLAMRLLEIAPPNMRRVLFNNSGSESNDAQLKIVRAYNNILGRPRKKKVISRWGAYHGATVGAGSLSGLSVVHKHFDLPIPGVLHLEGPDYLRRTDREQTPEEFVREQAAALDRLIRAEGPNTVAAFIAEPIMGSGGVIIPPIGYHEAIGDVLRLHDVLLIADEVITGFGRTGDWFASLGSGMRPDLMTCAKGMTSGYFPMSACLIGDKIWEVLSSDRTLGEMFGHGVTTAGHPVGAAAALKNLEIIEREALLQNARETGAYLLRQLQERLEPHPLVAEVRGVGLLCAVELDRDKRTHEPFADPAGVGSLLGRMCWEQGLMVRGGHGKVVACLAPPLILARSQADEIVSRLERALNLLADHLVRAGLWNP